MTEPGMEKPSVDSMVSDVAKGVRRLLRHEADLARAEIRAEACKAVRGAGAVITGAAALYLVAALLSVGGALALSEVLASRVPELSAWSTAITIGVVAVFWLAIGVALLGRGRRRLRRLSPIPRRTIASLREDITWLRKPNG